MVESESPELDAVFHALGDATRRRMIAMLAEGRHTVSELAEPFDISLAAVSKHVKVLEKAGLVRREIQWRTHVCSLAPDPLGEAHHWLDRYSRFWTGRLDALEALLRAEDDD
ncbi:helix-turn-helix transcriptional regulator, partial [Poseidonocella sp. HB161398]|uniref:ArsR/SmtB family transcription factor n=1 Tax=Poseidonocella sp. HB161398 TaxID=2320855 RepID=UPI0011082649